MAKTKVPAVEGWFSMDEASPHLIGSRCAACGSSFFPKQTFRCRNPHCGSEDVGEVALSRTGTVWSYTINHYPPPEPFVKADPFTPYGLAAVELRDERMVVLGQVAGDTALSVGDEVELVLDTLYEDDANEYVVWKWRKR